jgi:hypothetical protein
VISLIESAHRATNAKERHPCVRTFGELQPFVELKMSVAYSGTARDDRPVASDETLAEIRPALLGRGMDRHEVLEVRASSLPGADL